LSPRPRPSGRLVPRASGWRSWPLLPAEELQGTVAVGGDASKAFHLSYGRASVFFQGLDKVVGRADAEAGDDKGIIDAMAAEHCNDVDSYATFEPPNFLIPTTSEIEWWAVYDPVTGLKTLGIDDWPKEKRLGGGQSRSLRTPAHWKEPWEQRNAQLAELGELPLQHSGFVALRLYTGPMFYKYSTPFPTRSAPVITGYQLQTNRVARDGWRRLVMAGDGWRWLEMAGDGPLILMPYRK